MKLRPISYDAACLVSHRPSFYDGYLTCNRTKQALYVGPHHALIFALDLAVLKAQRRCIHNTGEPVIAIRGNLYCGWMRQVLCRLVFEIDEPRAHKYEYQ